MTIHRIQITNFMGIAARELVLSDAGAIVEGGNARGKTSVLLAVRAALAGQGISADAIRTGATSAEIVINLDDLTVRRVIDRNDTSLVVKGPPDGRARPAPQALLTALLGLSPLDPLDLYLAKPRDRRETILASLPITVTEEDLRRWISAEVFASLSTEARATTGHGLDVVERARRELYDRRTVANREVETAEREEAAASVHLGAVRALERLGVPDGPTPAEAEIAYVAAERQIARIETERRNALEGAAKSASTRVRIAELREEAQNVRAFAPLAPTSADFDAAASRTDVARQGVARCNDAVLALLKALDVAQNERQEAEGQLAGAEAAFAVLDDRQNDADKAASRAVDLEVHALELEGSLAIAVTAPSEEEEQTARQAQIDAAAARETARLRTAAIDEYTRWQIAVEDAQGDLAKAREEMLSVQAHAYVLDAAVRALADAPAELLARSNGIPGLSVSGQTIALNGVDIDRLSGAERMAFCIDVARRAPQSNARSKLLVVDGLERLDSEQLRAFVEAATSDGFQLLATRVADGEARVLPIGGAS